MKLLIPLDTLDQYGARDLILLECENCHESFSRTKNVVCRGLKGTRAVSCCSPRCGHQLKTTRATVGRTCKCGKSFVTLRSEGVRSCSQACANSRPMSEIQKRAISQALRASDRVQRGISPKKGTCKRCKTPFEYVARSRRLFCSLACHRMSESDRCKTIPGMCKNNNRHAGWYESPIAGRVWLESSWEVRCAKILDKHRINWRRPKESFEWTDIEGKSHRYHPDFYLPDRNLYLDPKNPHRQRMDAFKIAEVRKRHPIKLLVLSEQDIQETALLALLT